MSGVFTQAGPAAVAGTRIAKANAARQTVAARPAGAQSLASCTLAGRVNLGKDSSDAAALRASMASGFDRKTSTEIKAVMTPEAPSASKGGDDSTLLVTQFYRTPGMGETAEATLLIRAQKKVSADISAIETEACYNIGTTRAVTPEEQDKLKWLMRETFEPEQLRNSTALSGQVVEVGPRMSFSTAYSSNAVSICGNCGIDDVGRLERSRRFTLKTKSGKPLSDAELATFAAMVHDRMTEEVYPAPLTSFANPMVPEPTYTIPVVSEGRAALEKVNVTMGLAMDDQDFEYYTTLFQETMKRDPTNVELFDIAQSNSEHSRHWFFKGKLTIDGEEMDQHLFNLVAAPYKANPNNSVIAFKDNSSTIRGYKVKPMLPTTPGKPGPLAPQERDYDLLLTAETHNFPSGVAPFPGAETGAGGRLRDTHATGKGSIVLAGTAGYCVGNMRLDEATADYEDTSEVYPPNLASPEQIMIEASNGASDYGNKFGEPLVAGFCRTFGQRLLNGERREFLKPIMFSAGIGQMDHQHVEKVTAEIGHKVVKIGGPAYRIGLGGGAASSVSSGDNAAELDFNAVQRGDAQMCQKLWRVVRTCVELGEGNPILSIHDQGAGGNCNVVKEIIYPHGAKIDIREIVLGDKTMSVLEIWGAEYQENDCMLIRPESEALIAEICARERLPYSVIGTIDGSGRVTLVDRDAPEGSLVPEDLDLEDVLGDNLPTKTYEFTRPDRSFLKPLVLPEGTTAQAAAEKVMRLPSVGSKRFLTNKVDRSVTGLIVQQQCCGPLQLPVADVAVFAQTHTGDITGLATSIGEQPLKGMIDHAAMARISLGEALTNLSAARCSSLADIRASGNWMHAAKIGHEGADMWDAAVATRDAMIKMGCAIDGGKDSLSMAARAGDEMVKCPGELVFSLYVTCPDVTKTVNPALLPREGSKIIHVDIAAGRRRLGGSALAQAFGQLGNESPDMDDVDGFIKFWNAHQELLEGGKVLAQHDISDGGIVTTLMEMAFSGNCGISADLPATDAAGGDMAVLFAEELGLVLQVDAADEAAVLAAYKAAGVPASSVGAYAKAKDISVSVGGKVAVSGTTPVLRDVWEETSFLLERRQASATTVDMEEAGLAAAEDPKWTLTYTPDFTDPAILAAADKPKIAVIREEGSNGDREMAAAFHAAGMEPWDVTMSDLLNGRITLDGFRGIVFVGGFSYADVLDSAKGWAGSIRFNGPVWKQFQDFKARKDTFSLGICNGCQLMALLGFVPEGVVPEPIADEAQPRFIHNDSGRFESRWSTVTVMDSPAIMLDGMGGSTMGVWVAHGEGKAHFPDPAIKEKVLELGCAPVRYVDSNQQPTEVYPANPNGATMGIAALCSADGRHLAMMPHPERAYLGFQQPWAPEDAGIKRDGAGPWIKMFQNAAKWCRENN
eukprot:CAMPEP_0182872920 /NCGR_PEP_ID=MMETSP0034_2-20130328/12013_1 /TAXON_ID=156128 /ORGANISM="Nephroselmis pyriformis, Strain CCMP717" /LENGTH=1409 /DNA_ID=CAMNT_0025005539 /DNA_START=44 /DNA_END=4273 /DNA_ORIENTATION=+